MKIAVVGAGVFGCMAALRLAKDGHQVDLYERHQVIMSGASWANQGRLHLGYHYPRSLSTALSCVEGASAFTQEYAEALTNRGRHYYAIAAEGSKTSPQSFEEHAARCGLTLRRATTPLTNKATITQTYVVGEKFIDLGVLRVILRDRMRRAGVRVLYGHLGAPDMPGYDRIVMATYSWMGRDARYEVTEIALVELPLSYEGLSFVVMDGPFVSLDPLVGTRLHMLYDVFHSVRSAHEGLVPAIPEHLEPYLDRGTVFSGDSNVEAMWGTARRFLDGLGMCRYAGSRYTVRVVPRDAEAGAEDARPSVLDEDGDVLWLWGGKLDTAPLMAREVAKACSG